METTQLKITGMSCDVCVQHVTKALQNVPGVQQVQVNLQAGTATVQHEGAQPQAMTEAVDEEGYEAQVT
ncbi:MAG: heavy-metal-associated domain-containing protein [Abitibacteriaceae bacterium]|nr:heavy-metal-associated domain-containing protein [Abditibacteriaceae bacterium]